MADQDDKNQDKDPEGDGGAQGDGGQDAPDFEALLAALPKEVQTAYQSHTKGLLGALRSERDKVKTYEKTQRDAKAAQDKADADALKEKEQYKTLAEKHEQTITALQGQIAKAQETLRTATLRRAFSSAAKRLGMAFAVAEGDDDTQAADDAFALADLDKVEIDDAGKAVAGMDGVLNALKAKRPFLFRPDAAPGTNNARDGRGRTPGTMSEAQQQQINARYGVRP